jgi:ribosome-associated protein
MAADDRSDAPDLPEEADAAAAEADAAPRLRLDDALKLAGIAATGGQAKTLIQSGQVMVNGVVEVRRKRRLSPGDLIEVGGERFEIDLADDDLADD